MTAKDPLRGEIWLADLSPVRGHEQAGKRPCLVVSVDLFNQSPAGLVIVLPVTAKAKGIRSHVCIDPPEAGIKETSYIKCEDVCSISTERLTSRWGAVSPDTLTEVEDRLRILTGL
jgi:mRNA interferase MazF